jgi:hypothetical protein
MDPIRFTADFDPARLTIAFSSSCEDDDVVLKIGPVVVLRGDRTAPMPIAALRRLDDYTIVASRAGEALTADQIALEGDVFEALTLASREAFLAKVQLHHSRYKSTALLALAARASFLRNDDFVVKAASLTIIAHRVLEKPPTALTADDAEDRSWILARADEIVQAGVSALSRDLKGWQIVRWTVSLATVAGYLSLLAEDMTAAYRFFHVVAERRDKVALSKVSAQNIANGCFVAGLLALSRAELDEAERLLSAGVVFFKDAVAPQNVLENVWVIGDLLNVGRASRQCFIALERAGFLPAKATPRIDTGMLVMAKEIKGPLAAILAAGHGRPLAAQINAINDAPVVVP